MDAEYIAAIAAIVLSLVLSYFPGIKPKWEDWNGDYKRLVMVGLYLAAAFGAYGLVCAGLGSEIGLPDLTCDQSGLIVVIKSFVAALIAGQSVYGLTDKS